MIEHNHCKRHNFFPPCVASFAIAPGPISLLIYESQSVDLDDVID